MEEVQVKTRLTSEDFESIGYKADTTYFTLEENKDLKDFVFTMATNGNTYFKICAVMK